VSGLALGADSVAHRAALSAGLHTIAIPGSGLSEKAISPRSNLGLAKDIVDAGGLLLSEHPPEYLPHPYDFPSRNRIMVGMSDAVLMIEAGEKSGSLISARLAGEYGRELLCIPHRIGDANGYGSHVFLRLGATLVTEPAHILEALRLTQSEVHQKSLPLLTDNELHIWSLLETPHSRDAVIQKSRLPSSDAITLLVTLELKGLVTESYGKWHRL
jgi:DNA processing protein